jgi:hypothetical protein
VLVVFVHAVSDLGFGAMGRWLVIDPTFEFGRPVLLVDPGLGLFMRVLVALSVTEAFSPLVVTISEVDWHLSPGLIAHIGLGSTKGHSHPIRLGGRSEVHHCVGQIQLRLGQANELDRPSSCVGNHERVRIGHTDVFAGQDHESAGNEASVFACLEHSGQPIQTSIGVGASNRLDERRDDVVVIVSAVSKRFRAEGSLDIGSRYANRFVDD